MVLNPASVDSDEGFVNVRQDAQRIDKAKQPGENDRNAKRVETVEKKSFSVTSTASDSTSESWPNVVTHDVQPEEAEQHADVDHVASQNAWEGFGHELIFELDDW